MKTITGNIPFKHNGTKIVIEYAADVDNVEEPSVVIVAEWIVSLECANACRIATELDHETVCQEIATSIIG